MVTLKSTPVSSHLEYTTQNLDRQLCASTFPNVTALWLDRPTRTSRPQTANSKLAGTRTDTTGSIKDSFKIKQTFNSEQRQLNVFVVYLKKVKQIVALCAHSWVINNNNSQKLSNCSKNKKLQGKWFRCLMIVDTNDLWSLFCRSLPEVFLWSDCFKCIYERRLKCVKSSGLHTQRWVTGDSGQRVQPHFTISCACRPNPADSISSVFCRFFLYSFPPTSEKQMKTVCTDMQIEKIIKIEKTFIAKIFLCVCLTQHFLLIPWP